MQFIKDLRLKAGVWARERKERAEDRKAQKAQTRDPHDSRFWLLSIPAAATLCAACVEVFWAILFCIEATGHLQADWATAVGSAQPATGSWTFNFEVRAVFVLIGLVLATIPIVMWSMVWLPVQMKARGRGRWRRFTMIATGLLANALVIVSGTVVMNGNRQEQVRAGLVVEQSAEQGRQAIGARLQVAKDQLHEALSNTNPYLNQAANVGAAEWERSYVTQARATNDPRLPQLERALGAARRADQLRADIERLTVEQAQATPAAATASHVDDQAGAALNAFATAATVYRPPFVALICTIIGIFGTWWWVGLAEAMNKHDVSLSGWAPESHRIEDHSDEAPLPVDPRGPVPPREVVTDADTGEELIKITPKAHWRKRKGQKQKVEIRPDIPPSEVGVQYDGAELSRIGSAPEPSEEDVEAKPRQADAGDGQGGNEQRGAERIGQEDDSSNVEYDADDGANSSEGGDPVHDLAPEPKPTFGLVETPPQVDEQTHEAESSDEQRDQADADPIQDEPPISDLPDDLLAALQDLPPEEPVVAEQHEDDEPASESEHREPDADHVVLADEAGVMQIEPQAELEDEPVVARALLAAK